MKEPSRKLVVMGDRVLISPEEGEERTRVGLYLPATAVDRQAVQSGRIVAVGPGMPMAEPTTLDDEPWRIAKSGTRFVPMQAEVGDFAIFFRKAAVEITFEGDNYLVVPQAAILVLTQGSDPLDDL
jgi:co-chaperonin GroES (HSP10)